MQVPCGQCIGCRIDYSRTWAVRLVHEASLHSQNCFLTLTYRPEDLPADGGLVKKHFQDFMKRLRKSIAPHKIRFFHCGEYGEKLSRPHYHAIIFGYEFPDKTLWKTHPHPTHTSQTLESLWGKGFCTIGAVTVQSAAYVARYVTKKITGAAAENHYETLTLETGEIHKIIPEYVTMSRRPGIAREWYQLFKNDVFPDDFVVLKGKKQPTPRYYEKLYKLEQPLDHEQLKKRRALSALAHAENNTPDRLAVRQKVLQAKISELKRTVESGT